MEKNKLLIIALSVLSLLAVGLGLTVTGLGEWFPPGGSTVP